MQYYSCTRKWVRMDLGLSDKILNTELSAFSPANIYWRFPCLRLRVAIILSHSVGGDLLGCQSQFKRKEGKGYKDWKNDPTCKLIWTHKSHHRSVQLNGILSGDSVHPDTTLPLEGGKTHAQPIYTTPKSNQQRRAWRNKSINETCKQLLCPLYLHPRTLNL